MENLQGREFDSGRAMIWLGKESIFAVSFDI